MLRQYHPLYINVHFNHPDEITPQSAAALIRLADAGIPLGSQTVLLESNHDLGMLFNGPYPYVLKQRISSDVGHLNNDDAADTALDLVRSGTQQLILGHLSAENNMPDLAYQTTASMLLTGGAKVGDDCLLDVAPRNSVLLKEVPSC